MGDAITTLTDTDTLRNTPIIVVTSYAMVGDREKYLAAGCNGYIETPINLDTFVAEIERYLSPPIGGGRP